MTDRRCVVSVGTGGYTKGLDRLESACLRFHEKIWSTRQHPPKAPAHKSRPYAFKAYAIDFAAAGSEQVLWADSCILPLTPLDRIWKHAEKHGVWISNNGFINSLWTADSAYPWLFPEFTIEQARIVNANIKHVCATAFAIDFRHPTGQEFFRQYYHLAANTPAFCGPWFNSDYNGPVEAWRNREGSQPCGPPEVAGHRHDQTAASVISWRLGIPLTNPPDFIAYPPGQTEDTILLADGNI